MRKEEVQKLPRGLYTLYWNSGGSSLAAVGQLYSGERWFAPINWTQRGVFTASTAWHKVESVKLWRTRCVANTLPVPASQLVGKTVHTIVTDEYGYTD